MLGLVSWLLGLWQPKSKLQPTDSRPVCLDVRHTSGAHDQIFITVRQLGGFLIWHTLSDESTVLWSTIVAGPHQSSHSRSENSWPYFTVSSETPPTRGPGPHIYIPRSKVAQLHPRHPVPFTSPLTSDRDVVDAFDLPPHGGASDRDALASISQYINLDIE
jgi:hypothetical protein